MLELLFAVWKLCIDVWIHKSDINTWPLLLYLMFCRIPCLHQMSCVFRVLKGQMSTSNSLQSSLTFLSSFGVKNVWIFVDHWTIYLKSVKISHIRVKIKILVQAKAQFLSIFIEEIITNNKKNVNKKLYLISYSYSNANYILLIRLSVAFKTYTT